MELYPAYERSHLLARMPAPERRFLTEIAKEIKVEDGELLLRAGEPADRFFIIGKGRVELLAENGEVVDILGPGEMVGVSWYYPDHEWSLSARAQSGFIGVEFRRAGPAPLRTRRPAAPHRARRALQRRLRSPEPRPGRVGNLTDRALGPVVGSLSRAPEQRRASPRGCP